MEEDDGKNLAKLVCHQNCFLVRRVDICSHFTDFNFLFLFLIVEKVVHDSSDLEGKFDHDSYIKYTINEEEEFLARLSSTNWLERYRNSFFRERGTSNDTSISFHRSISPLEKDRTKRGQSFRSFSSSKSLSW